jgi:hypothetical protein
MCAAGGAQINEESHRKLTKYGGPVDVIRLFKIFTERLNRDMIDQIGQSIVENRDILVNI